MSLFRAEALRSKHDKRSGTVLHYSPWTRPVGGAALVLSAAVLGLVIFGHYTRAVAISGYLVPEGGILRVFAPQPGVVVEKRVKAGDRVVKGDLLYVVSADREGRGEGPLFARATDALRERRAKTADSIEQTRSIQAAELVRLAARRDEVSVRLALLDDKIGILAQSIELRSTILDRKKSLSDRHLTPVDQSDQAALSLLDLRTERASLQVDRSTLLQERAGLKDDLKLKAAAAKAGRTRQSRARSNLARPAAGGIRRRRAEMSSPGSRRAARCRSISPRWGRRWRRTSRSPLSSRKAQIFRCSCLRRAARSGSSRRTTASTCATRPFMYQKFGQYRGRVKLDRTHRAVRRRTHASLNVPQQEQNEPLGRIVVEPSRQAVMVNGGATPLQAGMAVDAFVMQETRAIYEWMLEPLFTVKGVTHAGASMHRSFSTAAAGFARRMSMRDLAVAAAASGRAHAAAGTAGLVRTWRNSSERLSEHLRDATAQMRERVDHLVDAGAHARTGWRGAAARAWQHVRAVGAGGDRGRLEQISERLNFGFSRRLPVLRQTEAAECGLVCLAMVASFHGLRTDPAAIRMRCATSNRGPDSCQPDEDGGHARPCGAPGAARHR